MGKTFIPINRVEMQISNYDNDCQYDNWWITEHATFGSCHNNVSPLSYLNATKVPLGGYTF
eukprot:Pgem_evm1s12661